MAAGKVTARYRSVLLVRDRHVGDHVVERMAARSRRTAQGDVTGAGSRIRVVPPGASPRRELVRAGTGRGDDARRWPAFGAAAWSGPVDPHPAVCDALLLLLGEGIVRDEVVDLAQRADLGEPDPADLGAVRQYDGSGAAAQEGPVGLCLHLVVGGAALLGGQAGHADERDVQVVQGEHALGCGTDQLVAGGPGDPADDHQAHVGPHDEVRRDVHRVRHDGEAAALGEHARQLAGRGASGEAHDGAVGHQPGGLERDAALLLPLLLAAVAQRQFEVDRAGHRPAAGALEQAPLVELLKVPADGDSEQQGCSSLVCRLSVEQF